MRSPSISVTFARTVAAMYALTRPAEPAPITTRFRSNRGGRGQRPWIRRAFTRVATRRASHGKTPSNASDPATAGETIPRTPPRLARRVPALT